jgi:hypothetical protein
MLGIQFTLTPTLSHAYMGEGVRFKRAAKTFYGAMLFLIRNFVSIARSYPTRNIQCLIFRVYFPSLVVMPPRIAF